MDIKSVLKNCAAELKVKAKVISPASLTCMLFIERMGGSRGRGENVDICKELEQYWTSLPSEVEIFNETRGELAAVEEGLMRLQKNKEI